MKNPLPLLAVALLAAHPCDAQDTTNFPTFGSVERIDPKMDELIPADAKIEVLASGFLWSEGPVWVPEAEHPYGGHLLFSDIPNNRVVRWDEGKGAETWLKPAGYTGAGDYGGEPGSNGLLLDSEGRLVFCEHGDRRLSFLTKDGGGKRTLVDNYQGKRLNSPNDAVFHQNGDLYFTDPPYGLPEGMGGKRQELDFCGVFRLTPDGEVTLLTKEMSRPNGIAFSPDYQMLYVANSDSADQKWTKFPVKADGTLGAGELFFDAKPLQADGAKGGCDGLKIDSEGNLWATGPGGVIVFNPEGKLLGRIRIPERTANCAWGNDGKTLYITSDMYLCRIQTNATGMGW